MNARRVLLAAAGATAGAAAAPGVRALAGAVAGTGAGLLLARRAERRRRDERLQRVEAALPGALDLLGACVAAGMSVESALRTVAPEVGGRLGEAVGAAIAALDAGEPRARAYASLAARAGSAEVSRLARALARADRLGAGAVSALEEHAADLRARARAAAEADARTASVRMIFPLALCFLPAFVLLAVAPAVLSALGALRGA